MAYNVKQTSMIRETCRQPTLSDVRRTHAMRDLHDSHYADSLPNHMRISAGHIHAGKALAINSSSGKQSSYEDSSSVPLLFESGIQHRFHYDQHHINEQYLYGGQDHPPILPVSGHQRTSYSLIQSQTPFLMKGHEIPAEILSSATQNCDILNHEGGYPIGQNNNHHLAQRFSSNVGCDKHRIKPYSPCELDDVSYDIYLL